ncbi:MAG: CPBP family intramembrane metalloprotease [Bacteroidales bacterium]|nr:CPBP family intramembrane metalloprotease [Bacteroidales bacterium]
MENRETRLRAISTLVAALIAMMVMTIVSSAVAIYMIGDSKTAGYWSLMVAQGISSIITFLVPAFIAMYVGERRICASYLKWKTKGSVMTLSILLIFVCQPLVAWTSFINERICEMPQMEWLKFVDVDTSDLIAKMISFSPSSHLIMTFLVISILPAICEEFFFRGVILRGTLQLMQSTTSAVVISAIFFSLIHLEASGLLPRIVLGFVLGFIYLKTGNLLYSIAAHVVNNAMVLVAAMTTDMPIAEFVSQPAEDPGAILPIISVIAIIIVCEGIAVRSDDYCPAPETGKDDDVE